MLFSTGANSDLLSWRAVTVASEMARLHGYRRLRVREVIDETADTRSFVFDVPRELDDVYSHQPGQFCTIRIAVDGTEVSRCYSMSSAPALGEPLTVTVKRVPGGLVSNWLHEHVRAGDELEVAPPSGVFCTSGPPGPLVAFCGGSGVTPVISIVRHTLATTDRPVRMLYANRSAEAVIFGSRLAAMVAEHSGRFEVVHHLDDQHGLVGPSDVDPFVVDDAEFFICGPGPFMDLIEGRLGALGVDPARIAIERFTAPPAAADIEPDGVDTSQLTMVFGGRRTTVEHRTGETVLDSARRAGLRTPYSCELGNCATCMARLVSGSARLRANTALTPEEVADGWILTCQAIPTTSVATVDWDQL